MSTLDALAASEEIVVTYRRYLASLLPVSDAAVEAALREQIESNPLLHKGPILEATPPYARGATIRELITEGVLHPSFERLGSADLPLDRPLYAHQELALRKAVAGRSLVVASGTGSGKTESFLLPVLNHLVSESAVTGLTPGVRALLLYPMNALANDQMRRLRRLLAATPDITFGRYIGDTENDDAKARSSFSVKNPGEPLLPNELLSRQQMRATPPHLLLTNYAMLEYLLLRPQDLDLFEGEHGGRWTFLVVDEAHVYDGARGSEIAMLLRRLRERVGAERLQCIATSATVGADRNTAEVAEFATNLFGQKLEWVDADPGRQDVVKAQRVSPVGGRWGPLEPEAWQLLAQSGDLGESLRVLAPDGVGRTMYDVLAAEASVAHVRSRLAAGPSAAQDVARVAFAGFPVKVAERALVDLVEVCARVCDALGSPLLSARYHLWLRATEGAYVCAAPQSPHVHISRHESCPDCGRPVWELGVCRRCGALHLQGHQVSTAWGQRLSPRVQSSDKPTWVVLDSSEAVVDEDDDALEEIAGDTGNDALLCVDCGSLRALGVGSCADPDCASSASRPVRVLDGFRHELSGCTRCGARGSGQVRVLQSGADASGAVIATSLYQELPVADGESGDVKGEGRKLLAFSDSRQAAAYFAPYLEGTYGRLQQRRLIVEGLEAAHGKDPEPTMLDDVIAETVNSATEARLFSRRESRAGKRREVATWVAGELVSMDERQSLEGLGLVEVSLDRDDAGWICPPPLLAAGLREDEVFWLVDELVRSLRLQGAVTMPEDVDPADDIFEPRLGPIYVRKEGSQTVKKILSWLPTRGSNRRLDYVSRVLASLGSDLDPVLVLSKLWDSMVAAAAPVPWIASDSVRGQGLLHQVDSSWLRWRLITEGEELFRCSRCRKISARSVRRVCSTLRCGGTLEPFALPSANDDSAHYRRLARTLRPSSLVAREHTAQWDAEEGARIQQQFVNGEVNALSCSTTFELGVDVGELQSVMLRNVPPTTANYIQRAGRAGRRASSAALVVTYANRRSHDLAQFERPERMIAGDVRAPMIPIGNERIDRRHLHSIVLSSFFRYALQAHHVIWRKAGEFFLPDDAAVVDGRIALQQFVDDEWQALIPQLVGALPPSVHDELEIQSGGWRESLMLLVDRAASEIAADVAFFEEERVTAFNAGRDSLAASFGKVANTIRSRDLLGYLGNRNILPKYGFPVDVVDLRTAHSGQATHLDLSRDLSMAIHEYAPGAQIVAGGKLWTSGGVYRLPGKELVSGWYALCRACGAFRRSMQQLDAVCDACGQPWTPRRWMVPEFGFMSDRQPGKVGQRPPQRMWSGGSYVVDRGTVMHEATLRSSSGAVRVEAASRARLMAVSEGAGASGFFICQWCGRGLTRATTPRLPKIHDHLWAKKECSGSFVHTSLAHEFQTDVAVLAGLVSPRAARGDALSLLYGLLEGAAEALEIARDDIDGTLDFGADGTHVVIFDTVPGGAGHAVRIAQSLTDVIRSATRRLTACECGPETSCYACLRTYRNQSVHEQLSRGAALELMGPWATLS